MSEFIPLNTNITLEEFIINQYKPLVLNQEMKMQEIEYQKDKIEFMESSMNNQNPTPASETSLAKPQPTQKWLWRSDENEENSYIQEEVVGNNPVYCVRVYMADFKNEQALLCKLYEAILDVPNESVQDVPGDVDDMKDALASLVAERCKHKDILLMLEDYEPIGNDQYTLIYQKVLLLNLDWFNSLTGTLKDLEHKIQFVIKSYFKFNVIKYISDPINIEINVETLN